MAQNNIKAIPLTQFNAASLNGTYQPINAGGLDEACFLLRIINGSNVAIVISYDGVTDHDALAPNQTLQLPVFYNAVSNAKGGLFAKGTIVYVTQVTAPGVGGINLIGYYNPN